MPRRVKVAILSIAVGVGGVRLASANPSGITGITGGLSALAVPLLFPLEGVLIAALARKSSVRVYRFVALWTAITLATFALLLLFLWILTPVIHTAALVAGEAVVILIEAYLIFVLLGRSRFVDNPEVRPSFGRALWYSFVVNLVSFFGGALSLMLV